MLRRRVSSRLTEGSSNCQPLENGEISMIEWPFFDDGQYDRSLVYAQIPKVQLPLSPAAFALTPGP